MINQNYEKLIKLNLNKMAELYREQSTNKMYMEMSFDERFALLIDGETDDKYNKLIYGIQRRSNIKMKNATVKKNQKATSVAVMITALVMMIVIVNVHAVVIMIVPAVVELCPAYWMTMPMIAML